MPNHSSRGRVNLAPPKKIKKGGSGFCPPPPQIKKKNQSCSKLREMARKFVEIEFRIFGAPPQKKIGGRTKKNWSKKKKIKVVQSCLKW